MSKGKRGRAGKLNKTKLISSNNCLPSEMRREEEKEGVKQEWGGCIGNQQHRAGRERGCTRPSCLLPIPPYRMTVPFISGARPSPQGEG